MSWEATSEVTKKSNHEGSNYMVLLMMANRANPDGTNIWLSVKTLASDCRLSERSVQYCLRELMESGEIEIEGVHHSGTNLYRICYEKLVRIPKVKKDNRGGARFAPRCKNEQGGGANVCTQTVLVNSPKEKDRILPYGSKGNESPTSAVEAEGFHLSPDSAGTKDSGRRKMSEKQEDYLWAMGRLRAVFPGWEPRTAPARDMQINRFLRKFGRDGFNELMTRIHESDWLMARGDHATDRDGKAKKRIDPSWPFLKNLSRGGLNHEHVMAGLYSNEETASWGKKPVSYAAAEVEKIWIDSAQKMVTAKKSEIGTDGLRYEIVVGTREGFRCAIDHGPDMTPAKWAQMREDYFSRNPGERAAA